ncbi:NAD(P)/FAD-dependent oxidoreductase [Parasphingopyxis sp.]|uniref:FAD-dependent oxidoreductase n=1 Tax=Parasphingopyxis sp. TaxID=1920299 RepID=UPI002636AEED|nr:NAD(P)/FAD-dependent oxidoreductase [Parasphingopyxis sp.]
MARAYEIGIAGCGPGGLAAALFLHRLGHRITLFERFEEPRPVGSGLLVQPSGLEVLETLGLAAPIRERGARIDFLKGTSIPSGKRALDVRYGALRGDACAYGVHRALLFGTLYDAVRAEGIAIETGRTVTAVDIDTGGGRFDFADGATSARFDCLIDALGARTPLAPPSGRDLAYGALWATLDWPHDVSFLDDALDQRYRRAHEMVGVMPIGLRPSNDKQGAAFFWSVRADQIEALHAGGTAKWRDTVLALWPETAPLLDQIADTRDMVFAHYAHRTVRRPVSARFAHLGDAWHSTSPQLGQGANMALLDAAGLASAFHRHTDIADALAYYAWLRTNHIQIYQALSCVFTPLYQAGDGLRPFIRDQLVHWFAGLWPARNLVAAIVSGGIGWPLRPMRLDGLGSRNAAPVTTSGP